MPCHATVSDKLRLWLWWPLAQEKIAFDIPVKIAFRRFLTKTRL